jgi:hypothetical protein
MGRKAAITTHRGFAGNGLVMTFLVCRWNVPLKYGERD